jgi:hypothetical protein
MEAGNDRGIAEWRPATAADLAAIQKIADAIHIDLPERPEIYAEKLELTNQDLLTSARLEPPTLTKVFSEMSATDRGAGTEVPITVAEARALLKRWKS